MRFAWTDTLAALESARADKVGHFGPTIELPAPGMPTITVKVHKWPKNWRNRAYRHSANNVYVVMQGTGTSKIGDAGFEWNFGDTIAAPAWCSIEHSASDDTVMFLMSDENLMRWTRYYRLEALE
jgi:gentisate 1,2-dioxygenase